ncbi:arsenate reductase family protein [Allofustis seminis]|uniref:arsenate reductase family protein n=1 Tax=Allofustis seminis TaxID=166939 RepID=UPI00036C9BE2|nr:arsenate reductase family protein [Allofustis seminis]
MQLIEYPKCSTCKRAKQWLDAHHIDYSTRHIVEETPTVHELKNWYEAHNIPLKKLFNTSGQVYRKLHLKDKLKDLSEQEQLTLLSSNGMLIKRPLLIGDDFLLIGFKEQEWADTLLP